MKRTLPLSVLAAMLSISALAQPVIQASDINYVIGESYTLHLCDWESAGSSGANQTWDFSDVSENNTASIGLVAPSASAAASNFPQANVAAYVPVQETYQFFSANSSASAYYGLAVPGTTIPYSNGEVFFTYPLTYSNTNNDLFGGTFNSGGYNWTRTGTINSEVDGYGTLITPAGTYTNVLRVKIEEDYDDEPTGVPQVQNTTSEVYHWYKAGIHYPIAVNTSLTSGGFPQYLFQFVDATTGIEESDAVQLAVYPNPATEILNVVNDQFVAAQYEIVDVMGREVLNGTLNSKRIDVNSLKNGSYFLRTTSTDGEIGFSRFQVFK